MQRQIKKFIRIATAFGVALFWLYFVNQVSKYGADQRIETIIIYRKLNGSLPKTLLSENVAAKLNITQKTANVAVKPAIQMTKSHVTVASSRRLEILKQTPFPFKTLEPNSNTEYMYKNYDIRNPKISYLKDSSNSYTVSIGSLKCFREGTDISATTLTDKGHCICIGDWWGKWCSFPQGFKTAALPDKHKVYLRDKPRRIIIGTPFNMEFEMLEARMAELGDSVELFVITESNYTAYGDGKPRKLLNRLLQGYLLNIQHKIVYVALDHFPSNGKTDGWVADDLPRHELGLTGVMKQINNTQSDDLFLISDTDEIPSREAVLFLKMHNGYPEPFGFHLKWTTYGFYWKGGNGNTPIMSGSSYGMLRDVFKYRAAHVRNPEGYIPYHPDLLNNWKKKGNDYKQWKIGSDKSHVGWHCSWCFSPQMALIKLVSAQNGDFPRWGDHEKNLDINFLKILRAKGQWFDNSQMTSIDESVPGYAPKYLIENRHKYPYLIRNVYKEELKL